MDTKTAFLVKAGIAALGVIGTIVLVALGKAPIESVQGVLVVAMGAGIVGTAAMQGASSLSSAIRATAGPTTTTTTAIVGDQRVASVAATVATEIKKEITPS